jgi:hypothetical protein
MTTTILKLAQFVSTHQLVYPYSFAYNFLLMASKSCRFNCAPASTGHSIQALYSHGLWTFRRADELPADILNTVG